MGPNSAAVERSKVKKAQKKSKLSLEFYFKTDKKKTARMRPALPQNRKIKEKSRTFNRKYL